MKPKLSSHSHFYFVTPFHLTGMDYGWWVLCLTLTVKGAGIF